MAVKYTIDSSGRIIPVDDKGRQAEGYKTYDVMTRKSGKSLVSGYSGHGTKEQLQAFTLLFFNEGRMPTKEDVASIIGKDVNSSKVLSVFNNFTDSLNEMLEKEKINTNEYINDFEKYGGIISEDEKVKFNNMTSEEQEKSRQEKGNTPSDRPYTSVDDYFNFDDPNSIGGKLYNTYKEINQGQYESALLESQYQERDMNKAIAGERQALMDQIREDRRRSLKSGLSQSAIANREIQGLLQGQAMASSYADEFLRDRRSLNQMGQNIDSMSKGSVLDTYNQGLGNMIVAGGTNDATDFYTQWLKQKDLNSLDRSKYNLFKKEQTS